jgi:tRNA A58 N-methylase Trm61
MRIKRVSARGGVSLILLGALLVGCSGKAVSAAEFDEIVDALGLEAGATVADVGAGDGEWAIQLAQFVGPEGHVWATEVERDDVEDLEGEALDAFLSNVTVVLGDQSASGLPAACCDAILLRMVYHHFVHPERMRASLRQALKPGGKIAIVDITPQTSWRSLPEVPDRGGHGIPLNDLIEEMTADGFEVISRQADWNGEDDRYCVVFRR